MKHKLQLFGIFVISAITILSFFIAPACATQWFTVTPSPEPQATQPTQTPVFQPIQATPAPTTSLPEGAIGIITVTNPSGVNVRDRASQNASQIGFINPGETYVCVGVASNGWYEIVYPISYNGFVSNKLVRFSETGSVKDTCSYVIGQVRVVDEEWGGRMTKGPSPHTDYMGYATPGRTYQCVKVTSNGWYAILREENGFIVYIAPESGVWITQESDREVEDNAPHTNQVGSFVDNKSWFSNVGAWPVVGGKRVIPDNNDVYHAGTGDVKIEWKGTPAGGGMHLGLVDQDFRTIFSQEMQGTSHTFPNSYFVDESNYTVVLTFWGSGGSIAKDTLTLNLKIQFDGVGSETSVSTQAPKNRTSGFGSGSPYDDDEGDDGMY